MFQTQVILKSIRSFQRQPLSLLLLQLPAALAAVLNEAIPAQTASTLEVAIALAIILPLLVGVTTFSTAATYVHIKAESASPSLRDSFSFTLKSARQWLPASFVVSVLVLLGLPLVVVGIYFSAIYLFVPHEVIDEPGRPISLYLNRSKKLAKLALMTTLVVATLLLVIDFGLFIGAEQITETWIAGLSPRWKQLVALLSFKALLSLGVGAIVNVGLSHLYLSLKEART